MVNASTGFPRVRVSECILRLCLHFVLRQTTFSLTLECSIYIHKWPSHMRFVPPAISRSLHPIYTLFKGVPNNFNSMVERNENCSKQSYQITSHCIIYHQNEGDYSMEELRRISRKTCNSLLCLKMIAAIKTRHFRSVVVHRNVDPISANEWKHESSLSLLHDAIGLMNK